MAARRTAPLLEEAYIAGTFAFAHAKPWTKPFHPYLLTDHFYDGAQEDATELLTHFLLAPDTAPTLHHLVSGMMSQTIVCPSCEEVCSHQMNPFHILTVPSMRPDFSPCSTVQEAVDACWSPEAITFAGICPACSHGFTHATRTFHMDILPEVLYVTFNMWMPPGQPPTNHVLDPSCDLIVNGTRFRFAPCVLHLGQWATRGHYVAVARQPAPQAAAWMYNDSNRRYATVGQLQANARLTKREVF